MRTEGLVFVGVGSYLVLAAVAYGLLAQEPAGTTMLALAGGLGLLIGSYLRRPQRVGHGDAVDTGSGDPYLPHASIWPFAMGLASFVTANGLALGLWALLPGALLLAASVVGFCRQSRYRG